MRVDVSPPRLEATPGAPQAVAITITNPGTVIGGYAIRVLGADPSWVQLEDERVSLFPDESRVVVATITLPPGLAAGERRMAIQVRELTPPQSSVVEELVLVVPAAPSTQARIDPVALTAGRTGRFSLLLDNNGNTRATGWFAGDDGERRLSYRFDPPEVDLAPGEHAVVDVRVRGRRPLVGQPALRALNVHLVPGPRPPHERNAPPPPDPEATPAATASMVQTALLSRGPIGLVGLLAAITVFAVVITIVLTRLVGQSAADRNLALEIAANQGSSSGHGSSAVSGTVRLLTTGRPVAGVAVNVYAADDLVTPLASVASNDQGRYKVEGLGAGDYKLTFRGAGFEPLWYPRSVDADNAEAVTVDENHRLTGLDVALGGTPATISGTVVGEDVTDASVALRTPSSAAPVDDAGVVGAAQVADDGATVDTVPVAADGTFTFGDVPSPSVYDVVVTKEGFATSSQRVDVSAGEDRDGVEITLVQGNGVIGGTVVSDGEPLDGVTITATSGDASASTVSLSTGDVGSFTLRRLPTPATYTVVASKEGYATQTLSLTVGDGQALTGVSLNLGASSGSLAGHALLRTGDPAGGVTVTVTDGVQTVETATHSTGSPDGGRIGDWRVSGLSVPGTYTVTLSRADLAPQTVSVSLDERGVITPSSIGASVTSNGIETVLKSSTAAVHGKVTQPGLDNVERAVGEVRVELTSGASTYVVTTASVPSDHAGEYRVEGIPPGTYTVSLSRSGVRPTSTILELAAGEAVPYSPVLPKAASLQGVVLEAAGDPVNQEYVVELYRAGDYPSVVYRTTRTGANGRYTFPDVDAPEVYVVQVRRTRGSAPVGSANVTVSASKQARKNVLVSP